MKSILRDVKSAYRQITRHPGLATVVIVALTLGIAANTAMFSIVDSLLLRPLPVNTQRPILTLALGQKSGVTQTTFSAPEYQEIRAQSGSVLSDVMGVVYGMDGLSVGGRADRIMTYFVSGNFFSALGVQPAFGRLILPSEDGLTDSNPVVVLGYGYWKARFNGNPGIVGSKVLIDGHPFTVIGVAPQKFFGLNPFIDIQAYMPLNMATIEGAQNDLLVNRSSRTVNVFALSQLHVSLSQVQAALATITRNMAREYPDTDRDLIVEAYPEATVRMGLEARRIIPLISGFYLGLAAVVLLLTCINVAGILLARMTIRMHEMAMRVALGASRSDLVRQMLLESMAMAMISYVSGIALGLYGSYCVSRIKFAADIPFHLDFGMDWRILGYVFLGAILAGLTVGVFPAIRISRQNPGAILNESSRGVAGGKHRLRSALVVLQVTGSLVLLVVSGLFTHSLYRAQHVDLGFNADHVVNFSMDPNENGYSDSQSHNFYDTLLTRIHSLPSVEKASIATAAPMAFFNTSDTLLIQGHPSTGDDAPVAYYDVVSPGYFDVLKIPRMQGRLFDDSDHEGGRMVAVINASMAQRFWPGKSVVGQTFRMSGTPKNTIEVIGVVKDSRFQGIAGTIEPLFYLPYVQHYASNSSATLQVRSSLPTEQIVAQVEGLIRGMAPDLPIFDVGTMQHAMNTLSGYLIFKLAATLAAVLGTVALILAVVGVYAVISYSTHQRTQEIGVRMALGASRNDILKMILRHGFVLIGIGVILGLALSAGISQALASILTVSPLDWPAYAVALIVLSVAAIVACYLPARKAMQIDPMAAMRG